MSFTKVSVAGIGTTGTITFTNVNVAGVITATSFSGSGANLTGVASTDNIRTNTNATFLQSVNVTGIVTAAGVNASGVITATSFSGSGANLTGVASTDNIRTNTNATFLQNINVTGIVTTAGVNASGVITATSFSGSGANLTGLAATANVTTSSLVVIGVSTVAAGSTAAPSITPTGDTNTGIFFPSADTIAFSEGGSEAARFDSSGRLLVGTSSARTNFSNSTDDPQLQIESSNGYGWASIRNSNSSGGAYVYIAKSRGTGNVVLQNNDIIGGLNYEGNDGSEFVTAAQIRAEVDGTPGANDMPGRLVFSTTADNASSPTARLTIFRDGTTEIAGGFLPTSDNSYNLGGAGQRWATVYAANGSINTSDGREKTNVEDSVLGADFIKSLRPVSYKWIEGGKRELPGRDENGNILYETLPGYRTHWGFIAQEIKEAVDEAGVDFGGWILTDKDDPDSQQGLRYHEFIAPLTKALQEALEKIESLEAKVAALESA